MIVYCNMEMVPRVSTLEKKNCDAETELLSNKLNT